MDVKKYLERIHFTDALLINEETLIQLHERHVRAVPFGNLDIHFKGKLSLNQKELFDKVVVRRREGFCYELNYLFHLLLIESGFQSKMISCRIFTSEGFAGPEFDHLAIIVDLGAQWLLDVGFGDLFIKPLKLIEDELQFDGRNYFKVEKETPLEYLLLMSSDGVEFEKKYSFTLTPRRISDFESSCVEKQTHPDSYFVQNTICTLPTEKGRMTIFNTKLIEKEHELRSDTVIESEDQLLEILRSKFGVDFVHLEILSRPTT